jgi:hypothetical protein
MADMRRILPAAFALVAVSLFVAVGCSPKKDRAKTVAKQAHDHPDHGPHGGALAEWGEEDYHVEFTVDHDKKTATIYILDETAKKASPIAVEDLILTLTHVKTPVVIALKAQPDASDPPGKSSRFVAAHDVLGDKIEFKGEISGKVGDKPYSGEFVEKDDHDHKKK